MHSPALSPYDGFNSIEEEFRVAKKRYTHAGGIVARRWGRGVRYLLVQSSTNPDHWVLPKGHIQPGESSRNAALREVREEAGIDAEIVSRLGESTFKKGKETVRVLYYAMRFKGIERRKEPRRIRWYGGIRALDALSFKDARRLLRQAMPIST